MFILSGTALCFLACQPNYTGGIYWGRHRSGLQQQARIRCSTFHRSFRPGVYITRSCDVSGEWGDVDFSMCTMRPETLPLVMVEGRGIVAVNMSSFISQVSVHIHACSNHNKLGNLSEIFVTFCMQIPLTI